MTVILVDLRPNAKQQVEVIGEVPAARMNAVGVRDDDRAPHATQPEVDGGPANGVVDPCGSNRLRKGLQHSVGRKSATPPLAPAGRLPQETAGVRPVFVLDGPRSPVPASPMRGAGWP